MRLRPRLAAIALGTVAALCLGAAPASAAPTFSTPAVTGIELPPVAPPGASFTPVTVTAAPGVRPLMIGAPATTEFRVAPLAPHTSYNAARYLIVDWRNLQTGKTGAERLRYWHRPAQRPDPQADNGFWRLPTSATAATGAGPVVATVRIVWKTWNDAPRDIQLIPGTIGILAE